MRRFNDYLDFFSFLQENLHLAAHGEMIQFYEAVNLISQGCSCGKKKREATALDKYLNVESLMDDIFRDNLKVTLQVGSVEFFHDGIKFFEL